MRNNMDLKIMELIKIHLKISSTFGWLSGGYHKLLNIIGVMANWIWTNYFDGICAWSGSGWNQCLSLAASLCNTQLGLKSENFKSISSLKEFISYSMLWCKITQQKFYSFIIMNSITSKIIFLGNMNKYYTFVQPIFSWIRKQKLIK